MYIEINYCPFCGEGQVAKEFWPTGSSWHCRFCKREFLVELSFNGPFAERNSFSELRAFVNEDTKYAVHYAKPKKPKSHRQKSKRRKRRKK